MPDIIGLLTEYWWMIAGLVLLWLYSKLQKRERVKTPGGSTLRLSEMAIIVEVAISLIVVYLFQTYLYNEHYYFILAVLGFTIIMAFVFNWLDSKRDQYIYVSSMQAEILYGLDLSEIYVPQSQYNLWRMPRDVYLSKTHVGDARYQYWKGSDRVINADYYDGQTFYHPEHPELHNITFSMAKPVWMTLKAQMPALIKENVELSVLSEWRVADAMRQMEDKLRLSLPAIRRQHPVPFQMPDTWEEIIKRAKAERLKMAEDNEREALKELINRRLPETGSGASRPQKGHQEASQ